MPDAPSGKSAAPSGDGGILRVLGIDTSLRGTGVGLVDLRDGRPRGVAYDVLRNPPRYRLTECLINIQRSLESIIAEYHPGVVAVEGVFFARYARSALVLGHARGAALATCAANGLPVFEYAPRRVKQAVVGHGSATKAQMQAMVASLLGLPRPPPEDAADALAIAICHINGRLRASLEDVSQL